MKHIGFALALLGAWIFSPCVLASPHEAHSHAHASTPAPIPAQRWATDAALREGMHRVHGALNELHRYELGQLPESQALASVAEINAAADYMFTNCKLESTPDTALHGMLAPLLAAAAQFKNDPKDMSAVAAMRQAVADYPRYFNDPGWTPLEASADSAHDH